MTANSALRLHCWEGYEQPAVVQPFERRSGVRVQAQTLISDADATNEVLKDASRWDILNINNAHTAKRLWPAGKVRALRKERFEVALEGLLDQFSHLYKWARAPEDQCPIGICQRFGAFNFVVNTNCVSRQLARDQGFALAEDASLPYGILTYEDFNVFHVCIAAGENPFEPLSEQAFERVEATAYRWFSRAKIVTDNHQRLNQALVEKTIAFYLSGGVYTASPARLAGHSEVEAITPNGGPVEGRGGIAFTEVTSALNSETPHPEAENFLAYLCEPQTAIQIAFVKGTCNPVAQMGDPQVMRAFSREQLHAIQWGTLEEDIARCADYDLQSDHDRILSTLRTAQIRSVRPDR